MTYRTNIVGEQGGQDRFIRRARTATVGGKTGYLQQDSQDSYSWRVGQLEQLQQDSQDTYSQTCKMSKYLCELGLKKQKFTQKGKTYALTKCAT